MSTTMPSTPMTDCHWKRVTNSGTTKPARAEAPTARGTPKAKPRTPPPTRCDVTSRTGCQGPGRLSLVGPRLQVHHHVVDAGAQAEQEHGVFIVQEGEVAEGVALVRGAG